MSEGVTEWAEEPLTCLSAERQDGMIAITAFERNAAGQRTREIRATLAPHRWERIAQAAASTVQEPTAPLWEVKSIADGIAHSGEIRLAEMKHVFGAGWEPFAVASGRIWLRRLKSS